MAYFQPYIDSTGLHIPSYTDIRDSLVSSAKLIFGNDIYLDPDSQDYQYISAIANKNYDTLLLAQQIYNSRSPATAIGSGLDGVIKINGIGRKPATYSTVPVILGGLPGTIISNGVVSDVSGINWSLPVSAPIGALGTVTVTATCQQAGPISVNPGDISGIVTPTYGWNTVTNNAYASPGSLTETDAALRSRQAISTSQPSKSILEGIKGQIAATSNVTRFIVLENDTGIVDGNGLPAHSITAVVEGGTDTDIANAMYLRKAPGVYTNGTTSIDLTDTYGQVTAIKFYRPSSIDMDVTINLKALTGYTSVVTDNIKNAVLLYLNSLAIGDDLTVSSLWGSALSVMPDLKKPAYSITGITAGRHGGSQGTSDVVLAFNEVAHGVIGYITINIT